MCYSDSQHNYDGKWQIKYTDLMRVKRTTMLDNIQLFKMNILFKIVEGCDNCCDHTV